MKQNIIKILKNCSQQTLLLAGLITLFFFRSCNGLLSSYTRHNEAVVVPDVKAQIEEAAALKEATCVTM